VERRVDDMYTLGCIIAYVGIAVFIIALLS